MGKPERKEVTWKKRRRWEGNTKVTLKENRREGVDWFNLAPERVTWLAVDNTVTKSRGSIKCGGELLD